jgi:protein SCO1
MSSNLLSRVAGGVLALGLICMAPGVIDTAGAAASQEGAAPVDEHAEHRAQMARAQATQERTYVRTEHQYRIPQVRLVDADETIVDFAAALRAQDTTIISFIFTTCAGVCPVITANMAHAIPELDKLGADYRVFLVSLDPEHDTPARLREYADRFRTGEKIRFMTGDGAAIFEVLRAFNSIYLGGLKMNHQPVTLIRTGRDGAWVRLDGMVNGRSLAHEVGLALNHGASGGSAPTAP